MQTVTALPYERTPALLVQCSVGQARTDSRSGTVDAVADVSTDAVLADDSTELFEKRLRHTLNKLEFGQDLNAISFVRLAKRERKIVHAIAEQLGHEHLSIFHRPVSILSISDLRWLHEPASRYECVLAFHYVGLFGPRVEQAAFADDSAVPHGWRLNRKKRDGRWHHITIVNPIEVLSMSDNESIENANSTDVEITDDDDKIQSWRRIQSVLQRIIDTCKEVGVDDDWRDLGLGKINHEDSACLFRVVSWPSAARVRERLSLPPARFHITVGFEPRDIHDDDLSGTCPPKDETSLVEPGTIFADTSIES